MAIEIVDLAIENGDFPEFVVCLPEGLPHKWPIEILDLPLRNGDFPVRKLYQVFVSGYSH